MGYIVSESQILITREPDNSYFIAPFNNRPTKGHSTWLQRGEERPRVGVSMCVKVGVDVVGERV